METATELRSGHIDAHGLRILMNIGVPFALLDARGETSENLGRIPNAVSLNAGSSDQHIKKVLPDKNRLIVTYCSNRQCPASHQLASRLMDLGYGNVFEFPEGFQGWTEAGFEVQKGRVS